MKYILIAVSFLCISCSASIPTVEDYYGFYSNPDTAKNEELILFVDRISPQKPYDWFRYIHIVRDTEITTGRWRVDKGERLETTIPNWNGIMLYNWKEYEGGSLKFVETATHFGKENKHAIVIDSFDSYAPAHPTTFVKQLIK